MATFSFQCDPQVERMLELIAIKQKTSKSELVRRAIYEKYIDAHNPVPQLQEQVKQLQGRTERLERLLAQVIQELQEKT